MAVAYGSTAAPLRCPPPVPPSGAPLMKLSFLYRSYRQGKNKTIVPIQNTPMTFIAKILLPIHFLSPSYQCIYLEHQIAFHPIVWLPKHPSIPHLVHMSFFFAMETMLSLVLNS